MLEMAQMREDMSSLAGSQPDADQMMGAFGRMQGMLMTLRQQASSSSPEDMKTLVRAMVETTDALVPLMEAYLEQEAGTAPAPVPRPGP